MRPHRLPIFFGMICIAVIVGCVAHPDESATHASPPDKKADAPPAPEIKKVAVGKNITLEIQGDKRRVLVAAEVCLREGMLEQLMTRKRTKEHEAILAADIDARELHLALALAGAEAGKPVQFRPKLVAPSGTTVKIFLEYKDKGKIKRSSRPGMDSQYQDEEGFPHRLGVRGEHFDPGPAEQ